MTGTPNQQLQIRHGDVTWREVGDEVVVLNAATGKYLTLNASAKELWEQLDAGTTRQAMVEGLVERHGIDRVRAEADVDAFVADIGGRGLLAEPAG